MIDKTLYWGIYILTILLNSIILNFVLQRMNRKHIPLNKRAGHWTAILMTLLMSPGMLIIYVMLAIHALIRKINHKKK